MKINTGSKIYSIIGFNFSMKKYKNVYKLFIEPEKITLKSFKYLAISIIFLKVRLLYPNNIVVKITIFWDSMYGVWYCTF